ncbi:hypothetical protein TRIP_D250001 [uncultured Paludibacter sp.]|nr:hypothetical protein TRIP_D250001 [uncultured Paludibacter sp.]
MSRYAGADTILIYKFFNFFAYEKNDTFSINKVAEYGACQFYRKRDSHHGTKQSGRIETFGSI